MAKRKQLSDVEKRANLEKAENTERSQIEKSRDIKTGKIIREMLEERKVIPTRQQQIEPTATSSHSDKDGTASDTHSSTLDDGSTVDTLDNSDIEQDDNNSFSIKKLMISLFIITALVTFILYMFVPSFSTMVTSALTYLQLGLGFLASGLLTGINLVGSSTLGLMGLTLGTMATSLVGGLIIFAGLASVALLVGATIAVIAKIVKHNSKPDVKPEVQPEIKPEVEPVTPQLSEDNAARTIQKAMKQFLANRKNARTETAATQETVSPEPVVSSTERTLSIYDCHNTLVINWFQKLKPITSVPREPAGAIFFSRYVAEWQRQKDTSTQVETTRRLIGPAVPTK